MSRSLRVKFILPALTEATGPCWRPIKYSLFPPLGLATLAAYLRPDDEAVLLDEHVMPLATGDEPDLVELSRNRIQQVIAGKVFHPFLAEIDFNPKTALAERWWPRGKKVPVVLDPQIAFGAPIVAGTAIRTSTLVRMADEVGAAETADAFDLKMSDVEAAQDFEQTLQPD